jgi:protein involved in polysaccharide export with SLBB domain
MKSFKISSLISIILIALLTQYDVFAQVPDEKPAADNRPSSEITIQKQDKEEDLIHFGDLIEIDVVGSSEYDWRGTISPEGFLDGVQFTEDPIYGLCRNSQEITQVIAQSYSRFLRDPQVFVRILDSSNRPTSTLTGAIRNPQRFRIKRHVLLNELIVIAGGLTDASSGEIQIFRPQKLNCLDQITKTKDLTLAESGVGERFVIARQDNGSQFINIIIRDLLTGNNAANPQILSGDIITVREAQPVYVIGGVESPKQISIRPNLTLTRAIASAGGLSKDADAQKITIFRRTENQSSIIEADLERIKGNQSDDIFLQAFDVVDVARRGKEVKKTPPILENFRDMQNDNSKLPLRIID